MTAVFDSAFTPLVAPRIGDAPVDIRDETARARARGYADGFAEGRRAALEEAQRELAVERERERIRDAEARRALSSALVALHGARTEFDARADRLSGVAAARIEELAVELSTTILDAELSDAARSAAHALRRALAQTPVAAWRRVSFNERDVETLRANGMLPRVEVSSSADVDPGGAIVEIEDGAVDARIAAALDRAAGALRGDDGDTA
ncbi:FliH/SctL family protein [Microbacterium sp. ASV49]|uniref:FliH/SctL family protein n=1 Tax=Microbacterium candidum TaxID=3041922 RepID=A0ABT7MTV1_9MICO|nr:FliH/SctL family protein [Microbacterium sp. ASV49]MDL9977875.1 FliH/SctL family protein [Microbacterium sp. ASV49]